MSDFNNTSHRLPGPLARHLTKRRSPIDVDNVDVDNVDVDNVIISEEALRSVPAAYRKLLEAYIKAYEVQKQRAEAEASDAKIDTATSLPNLRAFTEHGNKHFTKTTPLTIVAMDLDGFKQINDRFGHPEGDNALRHFATYFKDKFGQNAFFARTGGDEFSLIIASPEQEAQAQLNALREQFADQGFTTSEGKKAYLSFSYGAHQVTAQDHNFDAAFKGADRKLLDDKKETKSIRYTKYRASHPDPDAPESLAR